MVATVTAATFRVMQKKSCPDIERLICDLGSTNSSPLFVETHFTTWSNTDDVLLAETASPRYRAVIGCVPTASLDLASLATAPLSVTVPIRLFHP